MGFRVLGGWVLASCWCHAGGDLSVRYSGSIFVGACGGEVVCDLV